ncbi:MAG: cysteine--tRNA ligase [Candidatus Lindowbacteria bacterium]|nr:cysteine--tRNA ligase [Candidatus Lindowbacteria bacterium]
MKLYNTLTREVQEVEPAGEELKLYVCGITPYDSPHLGHARAAVVFDAFVRFVRSSNRKIKYVRNITDIDDKIIAKAQGGDCTELAEKYIEEYHAMTQNLGCLPPDVEPRVTQHIPEIIELIEKLIEKGRAYEADGSVYFSVKSFESYGKLSCRNIDDMIAGARVEPGTEKRDALDFALWKARKEENEPSWKSPWGAGRPGWHIECSAMSMKYLGSRFDIHGGGLDLIFPHHENERAQTMAATGEEIANIWMHNGLITINKTKMSKSIGNTLNVNDLLEKFGPQVIRFYILSSHFSSPIDFSNERLEENAKALERCSIFGQDSIENADDLGNETVETKFVEALNDNFNTAKALGILFDAMKESNKSKNTQKQQLINTIKKCGKMIGLELISQDNASNEDSSAIDQLIANRSAARNEKNFGEADRIRDLLNEMGIIVEDTAGGAKWRRSAK